MHAGRLLSPRCLRHDLIQVFLGQFDFLWRLNISVFSQVSQESNVFWLEQLFKLLLVLDRCQTQALEHIILVEHLNLAELFMPVAQVTTFAVDLQITAVFS